MLLQLHYIHTQTLGALQRVRFYAEKRKYFYFSFLTPNYFLNGPLNAHPVTRCSKTLLKKYNSLTFFIFLSPNITYGRVPINLLLMPNPNNLMILFFSSFLYQTFVMCLLFMIGFYLQCN